VVADEAVAPAERAALVLDWDRVLGLGLAAVAGDAAPDDTELPDGAADLLEARRTAREQCNWAESEPAARLPR